MFAIKRDSIDRPRSCSRHLRVGNRQRRRHDPGHHTRRAHAAPPLHVAATECCPRHAYRFRRPYRRPGRPGGSARICAAQPAQYTSTVSSARYHKLPHRSHTFRKTRKYIMASPVKSGARSLTLREPRGREGFAAFRGARLPPYGFVEEENAGRSSVVLQWKKCQRQFPFAQPSIGSQILCAKLYVVLAKVVRH